MVPIVLVTLTFVHDVMEAALYTATATLLVKTKTPQIIDPDEDQHNNEGSSPEASSQLTEYELLKSRSLAERVVLSEGLVSSAGSAPARKHKSSVLGRLLWNAGKTIQRMLGSDHADSTDPQESRPATGEQSALSTAIDNYLRALKIKPVEGTDLVRVDFTHSDPLIAAQLANAHAREFISWGIELNAQSSDQAEKFLQTKLADLKAQLEASEAAVNDYRKAKGIIPGLISSSDGKTDLVLARLDKLSEEAQDAHLKTISIQTELSTAMSGKPDAIPAVAISSPIQSLKQRLDEYKAAYASLQNKFTPDYPKMEQLRASIKATGETLQDEIQAATEATKSQYQEAKAREKAIDDDLEQQKSFALGLNNAAVRYGILERDADTNRQLYNAVLKRMKDLTLLADLHASNVSVVDEAEIPLTPSSPRRLLDLAIAMTVGLVAGIGLSFLLEQLDDTFSDPDEIKQFLGRPILAAIPEFTSAQTLSYGERIRQLDHNGTNGNAERKALSYYGGRSVVGEAYRALRTSLQLSRAGSHPRSTLITSALPQDGKTTVAVNTAVVLAHTGNRVLLIDADLRKPRCHRVLQASHYPGLTEVLIGQRRLSEAARATLIDNLFLLASGQLPPNPSELLGSDNMKELLQEAIEQYNYVLVDSPPIGLVSDGLLLSTLTDGVVVVVREGATPRHIVKAALSRLEYARAQLFGIAVNRVKVNNRNSVYSMGYYSAAGYFSEDQEEHRERASPLN
jgi:capsular exopolysaccharide synthesis family protein